MTRWLVPVLVALGLHLGGSQLRLGNPPERRPPATLQIASVTPLPAARPATPAAPSPSSRPEPSPPELPRAARPRPVRAPRASRPRSRSAAPAPKGLRPVETEAIEPLPASSPAPLGSDVNRALLAVPPAAPPRAPAPTTGKQARDSLRSYARLVRARMHQAKRYPRSAIRRRQEGGAQVRVRIAADGSLAAAPVLDGSTGYDQLDREILRMAAASAPYPKPPRARIGPVSVLVPVNFRLDLLR